MKNILTYLKSVSGKLRLNLLNTSAGVLVAGGLATGLVMNMSDAQPKQKLGVRSLSSVASSSAYEGLQRKDGQLTSTQVYDSLGQIANEADRARLEGASGAANDFGLDSLNNLDTNLQSVGAAAEAGASDGLGMGGNSAVQSGPLGSARGAAGPNVSASSVANAAQGRTQTNTLGTASMARASGSAFNAAAGSMGRSNAPSGKGGLASSGDGYQLSGAMPGSSTAVAALQNGAAAQRGASSFGAGDRQARTGKASRAGREANDLKDISKRSADAARNVNRSANEGARAFLASTQNSGGLSVLGDVNGEEVGSADFQKAEVKNANKIRGWGNKQDEKEKARQKARRTLLWLLLSTVAATALAIPFGYGLIRAGSKTPTSPANYWLIAAGLAILATAAAVASVLVWKASKYADTYSGGFVSTFSGVVGGVALACLGLTALAALKGDKSPLHKFFTKIMPTMKKGVLNAGKDLAKTTGMGIAQQELTKAFNDTSKKA